MLELAGDGVRLTKAAVAERLSIAPSRAGAVLDRMTRDGRLELDVDERSGEIFHTPSKRAAPAKGSAGLAALRDLEATLEKGGLAAKVGAALVPGDGAMQPARRRKLGTAIVVGGLLPGFGLAYAAPWPIVVAASIVVVVGAKVIAMIPIVSTFLLVPFLVVCAVASAILGGLYAHRYNEQGRRAPLGDEPVSPRQLLKRLRKK